MKKILFSLFLAIELLFSYNYSYGLTQEEIQMNIYFAEQGNAKAQFNLGLMYSKGEGVKQSKTNAVKWYKKSAEQGFAAAQYSLAIMYYRGEGIKQSKTDAAKWYKKAAKQGFAAAQFNLALMYYEGEGVRQNKSTAKEWFGKACDNGNDDGCNNYKILNEIGIR